MKYPQRMEDLWLPHPDEMLFSVFLRQFYQDWHPKPARYFRDKLGVKYSVATRALLPAFVQEALARSPEGHPFSIKERLVEDHSPIPLLTLFQPPQVRRGLVSRWFTQPAQVVRLYLEAHKAACPLQPVVLRYCPRCVENDFEVLVPPLPYWRISHQLAGVFVCPQHAVDLADGCADCDTPGGNSTSISLPGICKCGKTRNHRAVVVPFECRHEAKVQLARWMTDACRSLDSIDLEGYSSFWAALKATQAARPTVKELLRRLKYTYGDSVLGYFKIRFIEVNGSLQLHQVKGIFRAALHNLILASVFFESFSAFKEVMLAASRNTGAGESKYAPRWGPRTQWVQDIPKLVSDYKGDIEEIAKAVNRSRSTVRTAIQHYNSKVVTVSSLSNTHQQVVQSLRKGLEKAEIEKAVGVSGGLIERLCKIVPDIQDEWERASWCRYRREHRAVIHVSWRKVGAGHKLNSDRDYRRAREWLSIHDDVWLKRQESVRPKSAKGGQTARSRQAIRRSVDWDERDRRMLEWLQPRIELMQKHPPRYRVGVCTLLFRHPDLSAFVRWPDRFSQSAVAIKSVTETRDQYCKRRIKEELGNAGLATLPALTRKYVVGVTGLSPRAVRDRWDFVISTVRLAK